MQDFRKLRVWQAANQLTVDVYSATRAFPSEERFGLTAQLRSAAVSIQSNIAEGFGRGTRADTCRFLQMATGSAAELANQLCIALNVGYSSRDEFERLDAAATVVRKMLIRLILRLKSQTKYSPNWR
jgi:four helix bundle protein